MGKSVNFFNSLKKQFATDVHTCMIARIERFDPGKMKADVKPLGKIKLCGKAQEMPLIIEVPVSFIKAGSFFIRPPYNKGDLVFIIFAEHDIDNVMFTGQEEQANSSRQHSLDDAIVVGGIMPFTQSMPETDANSLIIAKTDLSSKVVLTDDGKIVIEAGDILIGDGATEGIPKGTSLKDWLDNHVHPYAWGDSGGSGDTEKPKTSSPEPSQKAKVM